MTITEILAYVQNLVGAYELMLQPLCKRLQLPQTAMDILLFLANNPDYSTATDIVKKRGIKANLVSVHVERLVNEGYLQRQPVPGDRRKVQLQCTQLAQPVIAQGREAQARFLQTLTANIDEQTMQAFQYVLQQIGQNATQIHQSARRNGTCNMY